MDDDVLSLDAPDSWRTDPSEVSEEVDLDVDQFDILDELEDDESVPTSPPSDKTSEVTTMATEAGPAQSGLDMRVVEDHGIGDDLLACSSSRASSSVEEHTESTGRVRECWICGLRSKTRMRRHVLRCHLPWFWYASTACWECHTQEVQGSNLVNKHSEHVVGCTFDDEHIHQWCLLINGSLHKLASLFGCTGLDDLLEYVNSRKLYLHVQSSFTDQEVHFLHFYAENYSPRPFNQLTMKPLNHVICILNWEIVGCLLRRLGLEQRKQFLECEELRTYEGADAVAPIKPPTESFLFIDTHFHLDLVIQRLRFRNFLHMTSVISPSKSHGFYYGIANYVFPKNWGHWKEHLGNSKTILVSFGIHPHEAQRAVTTAQMNELENLLNEDRCVAVGEIGIDYTTRCRCSPCRTPRQCIRRIKEEQERIFCHMLKMARDRELPIILHCRDFGDGSAANRTYELLLQEGCTGMKIHRHCFVGNVDELLQWQALPNVVFGVTWKSVKECPKTVSRILPKRIILETDSPFLSPYSVCPTNHPWNLPAVAEEVSRLRNVPLSVLNWTTNENAINFYNIPGGRKAAGANQRPTSFD